MLTRHSAVGESASVRELVRSIPAEVSTEGVADAGGPTAVVGSALALLLFAALSLTTGSSAPVQMTVLCCANLLIDLNK